MSDRRRQSHPTTLARRKKTKKKPAKKPAKKTVDRKKKTAKALPKPAKKSAKALPKKVAKKSAKALPKKPAKAKAKPAKPAKPAKAKPAKPAKAKPAKPAKKPAKKAPVRVKKLTRKELERKLVEQAQKAKDLEVALRIAKEAAKTNALLAEQAAERSQFRKPPPPTVEPIPVEKPSVAKEEKRRALIQIERDKIALMYREARRQGKLKARTSPGKKIRAGRPHLVEGKPGYGRSWTIRAADGSLRFESDIRYGGTALFYLTGVNIEQYLWDAKEALLSLYQKARASGERHFKGKIMTRFLTLDIDRSTGSKGLEIDYAEARGGDGYLTTGFYANPLKIMSALREKLETVSMSDQSAALVSLQLTVATGD